MATYNNLNVLQLMWNPPKNQGISHHKRLVVFNYLEIHYQNLMKTV